MRLCRLVLLWLMLLPPAAVVAQAPQDASLLKVEQQLLNMDFAAAEQTLANFYRGTTVPEYYLNHVLFYKAFIYQTASAILEYHQDADAKLAFLALQKDDPYAGVFESEILLKQAILYLMQSDQLKAANTLKASHTSLQRQMKRFPKVVHNQRVHGLFLVAMSSVPKQYQWIVSVLGMEGDFEQGRRLLVQAELQGEYLRTETSLILYYIERNMMPGLQDAGHRMDSLYAVHGQQLTMAYLHAHSSLDAGKHQEALQVLLPWQAAAAKLPYIYYLMGKAYYYTRKFEEAIAAFDNYLRTYGGRLFVADAMLKKGYAYALMGNRLKAKQAFAALAATNRISPFDEDTYARQWAYQNQNRLLSETEQQLLYSRYLYDAGSYAEGIATAMQLYPNQLFLSTDERTELYYRLGRLHEATGQWEKAKTFYRMAITQNPNQALWMKAFAHFYIARMMEREAAWQEARRYYREALRFDGYPFQRSLELKAKAGISRLKDKKYNLGEE